MSSIPGLGDSLAVLGLERLCGSDHKSACDSLTISLCIYQIHRSSGVRVISISVSAVGAVV